MINEKEVFEIVNRAIAHVVFDKENVAIGIDVDTHEFMVLEGATEEDVEGRTAYLIEASEYEGVVIPEGTEQLYKHSNGLHNAFLENGFDLDEKIIKVH